ncbi:receptor-like serine/threonine-protein kinase SD1-8 [Cornus florida]|uniref:receptor-like serine/threonine-protein kinase SD1-8 n=1 Tax=Cornus florida TaxID=4283 RepID=UPI00289E2AD4|nr:receptor-like serine/threonine-protein kinase SD1-8 [Cornus florida]
MDALSLLLTVFHICISVISHTTIAATHTLTPCQTLTHGTTLVSSNQRFVLGFFSPSGHAHISYLGIWYKDIPLTVVWVANGHKPLKSSDAKLELDFHGHLALKDGSKGTVWSSLPAKKAEKPILELLDSGNLVVKEGKFKSEGRFKWESFDFPCDTLLPGMKLGWDTKSGRKWFMSSWKTRDDPSPGGFKLSLEQPQSPPQLVLKRNLTKQSRWGPWDGKHFSGTNAFKTNPVFKIIFKFDSDQVWFTFEVLDESILLRFVVSPCGNVQFLTWKNHTRKWITMLTLNKDGCDRYGLCGLYGICYVDDPSCRCLEGFRPSSPWDWSRMDTSGGCRREYRLNCSDGDGFLKYGGLKLPDNSTSWGNLSLKDCGEKCLKDCACMAYTNMNINRNGSDCVVWLGHLIDIRNYPQGRDELYIRVARGELGVAKHKRSRAHTVNLPVGTEVNLKRHLIGSDELALQYMEWLVAFITEPSSSLDKKTVTTFVQLLLATMAIQVHHVQSMLPQISINQVAAFSLLEGIWLSAFIQSQQENNPYSDLNMENAVGDLEFHLFDLSAITAATDNFSLENKIGEGGFGIVYKGEFPSGQLIAVKRMSQRSSQGLQEFKNEASLIAKLQHRNLVRLLGCCIQGEERMLIYEYLPNRSLDQFIFDQARKKLLSWGRRLDIIVGIAKGLIYIHDDSRLKIIHRDLKTSNILLDSQMMPKISDFGVAKIFGGNETEERTTRVIGTHGYMSPEYVINGHFSTKSDVYSFGVLALEIVSGQKNWGFQHPDHDFNLLGHAWKLWNEGRPLEIIDTLLESFSKTEVLRCIQVGLLCVQQRSEDRPAMTNVICMLRNESTSLPEPQEPGFFTGGSSMRYGSSSRGQLPETDNSLTMTTLTGR